MKAAHSICAVLLAAVVAACVDQAAQQRAQIAVQYQSAMAACRQQFPTDIPQTIVAKVQCLNRAQAIALPNFGANQDLVQTFMAYRALLAEQIHNGKMTFAEGGAALAEKWSQLDSEMQRRNALAQSVAAQQKVADAQEAQAWGSLLSAGLAAASTPTPKPTPIYTPPVRLQTTCMRNGNMTYCN